MDLRDLLIRTGWTGVAAALAFLVEVLTDYPSWWAPIVTMAGTAALVWVRQRAAAKSAEIRSAGDLGRTRLAVVLVVVAAALAASLSIAGPAGSTPDVSTSPAVPTAVDAADTATAPEPAAAVGHTMSYTETWNICYWWRAVLFGHLPNNGGWSIGAHFHVHWWGHRQVRCNFFQNGIVLEFLYDLDTGATAFI